MSNAIALDITEYPDTAEPHYTCQVQSVSDLNTHCIEIFLSLPPEFPRFHAGQYLELILADGRSRPFSIANHDPLCRHIELHIEVNPDSVTTLALIEQLRMERTIEVKSPRGNVRLRSDGKKQSMPQVFMAAGSGFAQIKALLQQHFQQCSGHREQRHHRDQVPLYLIWGTESPQQRYTKTLVQNWLSHYQNLSYHPLNWQQGDSWESALSSIIDRVKQAQFYLCGSPGRVYQTLDYLEQQGIRASQVQSDVFAYAPRLARAG